MVIYGKYLRFINNTHDIQSCNSSCVFGSLTLSIVEISWHSDNSVGNTFSQISFSNLFHLAKNHSADFFSSKGLVNEDKF